jgi:hypothetical protein
MDSVIDNLVNYSRQSDMGLIDNRIAKTQIIIGCGGVGYWTAIFLAMMGARVIVLVDGDRVDATNLPRLPVAMRVRNDFKVKTLKMTIRLLRPACAVTCIPMHINKDTMDKMNYNRSIVWDCTDDARTQKALSGVVTRGNGLYYKLAYEGWDVAGYDAHTFDGLWIDEDYRAGYETNRANVLSSVIASALGILHVMTQEYIGEYKVNLREMVCQNQNG